MQNMFDKMTIEELLDSKINATKCVEQLQQLLEMTNNDLILIDNRIQQLKNDVQQRVLPNT